MASKDDNKTRSVILQFPRRRGRPKSTRLSNDSGTPELIMKRLMGDTAEALDLCLERGFISAEQHWCGIHLRWLYTLRHGAPGVRAIDPTHLGGIENKQGDPEWRSAREKEFHDAVKKLSGNRCAPALLNLCIYNERPAFLKFKRPASVKHSEAMSLLIAEIRDGLDILAKHWGRQLPKPKKK